jgi:hypothetical protein
MRGLVSSVKSGSPKVNFSSRDRRHQEMQVQVERGVNGNKMPNIGMT